MRDNKPKSGSSGKSSRILVSLSKVFSENGIQLVESCPECGNSKLFHLKKGGYHCLSCNWKGSDFIWKCAHSASFIELVSLIKRASIRKDVIQEAISADIRLPIEILSVQGAQ
jgi:hypothetical protein